MSPVCNDGAAVADEEAWLWCQCVCLSELLHLRCVCVCVFGDLRDLWCILAQKKLRVGFGGSVSVKFVAGQCVSLVTPSP